MSKKQTAPTARCETCEHLYVKYARRGGVTLGTPRCDLAHTARCKKQFACEFYELAHIFAEEEFDDAIQLEGSNETRDAAGNPASGAECGVAA